MSYNERLMGPHPRPRAVPERGASEIADNIAMLRQQLMSIIPHRLHILVILGLLLLANSAGTAGDQPVGTFLSHFAPHLSSQSFSHLLPHLAAPPEELLVPLPGGGEELLKGFSLADEARLAESLQQLALHQRPLRVAVGEVAGIKAALIKFQAGDIRTGQFQIKQVESDAAAALGSAFSSDPGLQHIDIWSVVPGPINDEGQRHQPVFSVSADRGTYTRAVAAGHAGGELLAALGVVRYDPLLTKYASDNLRRDGNQRRMPTTAYTAVPLGSEESWLRLANRTSHVRPEELTEATVVRVLLHGARNRRRVAITIDDGPCPLITPLILRILDKEGVRATFFVVGEKTEQYPELLREIVRAGHLVGNHTYHHRRLAELPAEQIVAEIEACQAAVGRLTGQVMRYLRPPGGSYSPTVLRYLADGSHTMVLWTHNAGDWGNPPVSGIVQRCLKNIRPGSIILMHGGDINSVQALPFIIRGLRQRGLEPVALTEMLGADAPRQLSIAAALGLPQNGWQPDTVK